MKHLHPILKHAADTSGGLALRRLIWSIWTQNLATPIWRGTPLVNLFDCITDLDDQARAEFAELIVLPTQQRADVITQLLKESGEWDRIDYNSPYKAE